MPQPTARRQLRIQLQFSLRGLLLIITLSGIAAGLYQGYLLPYQRQREAALALLAKGVKIEWQPAEPAWLRTALQLVIDPAVLQDAVAVMAEHGRLQDEDVAALEHLPRIQRLYLAGNPISNRGLKHLQGLTRLERLSLWGTKISDDGLRYLGRMESLAVLDIHDPHSYMSLGSAHSSQGMARTKLPRPAREYRLTSGGLKHLSGARNLRAIYFTFPVDDAGLAALAALPNLQLRTLVLQDVTAAGLAHLPRWPELQAIRVERAAISSGGFEPLGRLPNLRWLWLNRVQAANEAWQGIGKLTKLEQLSLSGSSILDDGMPQIGKLTKLQGLFLRNTRITDRGAAHLQRLKRLRELDLFGTRVTANGLRCLAPLRELEVLHFRAPLDDDAVRCLAGLPKLTQLLGPSFNDPCDAYLTDAGLAELAKLRCLQSLNLRDACAGAERPGVDVPRTAETMTDAGLAGSWVGHGPKLWMIAGRELSAAGFRWSPELSSIAHVAFHSPRSASQVIDCVLPLGAGSVELKHRMLILQAPEGIGPCRVQFSFGQGGCDLNLLRYVPTARHLKVHPNVYPVTLSGSWDNLRHMPQLETFQTPGGGDLKIDAVGIRHLGEMKELQQMVLDLPHDFAAADFAPLGRLKRLESLDLHCGPLGDEHLRVLAQISRLRKLRIFSHPKSLAADEGLRHLAQLDQLSELWLYGVTDLGMRYLGDIKSLVRLSVSGKAISDQGSRHLDNLPRLEYLDARSTGISDARLAELRRRQAKLHVRTDR